jgi:hypothetical protein
MRLTRVASLGLSVLVVTASAASVFAENAPLIGDATADPAATRPLGSEPALGVSAGKTSYVRFDLSRLPPGTTVHHAMLSVYVGRLLSGGSISVHRVTGAWDEDTLTAARQPTVDEALPETLVLSDSTPFLEYLSIDVTPAVRAWLAGAPNHGLAMRGDAMVDVELVSKENQAVAHPITLEVVPGGPPD